MKKIFELFANNFNLDRYDNIPLLMMPVVIAIWATLLFLNLSVRFLLKFTDTVNYSGIENLKDHENFLLCAWHQNAITLTIAGNWKICHHSPFAITTDDSWPNPCVWASAWMIGVRNIIIQKTGSMIKRENLIKNLEQKKTILITPDSPHAPFKVKKAIVELADQTGVPLLPVHVHVKRGLSINWIWDKKVLPLPFSTINISIGKPIYVDGHIEEARQMLENAINGFGLQEPRQVKIPTAS